MKILGKGVVKVVHRCDEAKENEILGEHQCLGKVEVLSITKKFCLILKSLLLVYRCIVWTYELGAE